MTAFGKSQTTKRFEDVRFLTGGGRYLDDTVPDGALHAFFVRSQYAHADLLSLDVADARAMPGVHAVLTAADLRAAKMRLDMVYERIELPQGGRGAKVTRPVLATDRVRFVGEPVAVVVAETHGPGARRGRGDHRGLCRAGRASGGCAGGACAA